MKYILILIVLNALVISSSAQEMHDQILSMIYTDSSAIRNQNILSLHVYSELSKNNYNDSENYVFSRKRSEIEFNKIGLRVYERGDDINSRSRALGDKNTRHISYTYDDKRRVSSNCSRGNWQSSCQYMTYNDEDKITSIKSEGSSVNDGLLTFTWKNGLMVEAKYSALEETNYLFERSYNPQGRISEMRQGNGHLSTYEYLDNGTETRMVSTSYFKDSLTSKVKYTSKNDTDQITYYCQLNGRLDTLNETVVSYNEMNDLVLLRHTDNSERLSSMYNLHHIQYGGQQSESVNNIEPSRIIIYTIDNIYENDLLIKRIINVSENNGYNVNNHRLVDRFIYEKTPLGHRSWPSDEEEVLYDMEMEGPPVLPNED